MPNYQQINIFTEQNPLFKIDRPIRLIETFAGIGSQAKALDILGLKYEHHKIVEWAFNSYVMYNMIHMKDFTDYSEGKTKEEMLQRIKGTSTNYSEPLSDKQLSKKPIEWIKRAYNSCVATHNLVNIMEVHGEDLEITETDKYIYLFTYSFPCQDLSLAGKRQGMSTSQKDGGTRSGLLWEIERILDELTKKKRESCKHSTTDTANGECSRGSWKCEHKRFPEMGTETCITWICQSHSNIKW